MTSELTVIQPAELIRQTTDIAGLCKEVVVRTAKVIGGRKFVPVEGWMTIATAHGCMATIVSVEIIEGGVLAVAELRRTTDGFVLSRAEGFVGNDEETWQKRAEYARRAMAQTRAMSRVCRTAFAHVVVMMNAGLETTPMEEVPHGGFNDGRLTTDPVPKTYWDIKHKSGDEAAAAWLSRSYDGAEVGVKKTDQGWMVVVYGEAIETRETSGAATSSASPDAKSESTERKATLRDSASSWRDVVCVFGKRNGPLRGKKLGELNDDSLEYLWKTFKDKEPKPADRKMVAALAIWHESGRKTARPQESAATNGDAPKFHGPNHEKLFEQLLWDKISVSDFLEAMRAAQVLPESAKVFSNMSDETAKMILGDMETAREHVRLHLEMKKEKEAKKK